METQTQTYVAYYRVSTKGQSLGIDGQRECCESKAVRENASIIAEYSEKESGGNDSRPELAKAIQFAKDNDAILLIAKLDRLSRSVRFLFELKESGAKIACCDLPELNTLTLGLFATIAEHEKELIGQRTKTALQEARKQGKIGGNPSISHGNQNPDHQKKASEKGLEVRRANARAQYKTVLPLIRAYRDNGLSYQKVADNLNANGYTTNRGKQWTGTAVRNCLKLVGELD